MKRDLSEFMKVKHHFSPNRYLKEIHILEGMTLTSHSHKDSHFSFLALGRVALTVDGVRTEHSAPDFVVVPADKRHEILGLEYAVWYCCHLTDERDVNKIDEILIKKVPPCQ